MLMEIVKIVICLALACLGVTAWACLVNVSNAMDRIADTLEEIKKANEAEEKAEEPRKPNVPHGDDHQG